MLWLNCLPEPLLAPELSNLLLQATSICQGGERLHVLQQVFSHVSYYLHLEHTSASI